MKSFGNQIWERKFERQGINGVIAGVGVSNSKLKQRASGAMNMIKGEILPLVKGKNIIDVGVGSGKFLIEFSKLGYNCDGLDVAQNILDYAKNAAEGAGIKAEFFKNDITKDFPKKKYDLVFCFGTFGHFPAYAALRVLENFKKMTNGTGMIYIHFWKPKHLSIKNIFHDFTYNLMRLIKKNILGKTYYVNCSYYSMEDIEEMAELSDLKIIKIKEESGTCHAILKKK